MSKKKATMTLKDFHGGSIPSDLHLPSAPGVTGKPNDRPMSWGSSAGRSEHWLRPTSAGSNRIDEKSTFLDHNSHIGRNFDEDERKPLDGVTGPRRTVADESFRAQPSRIVEHEKDNTTYGARVGSSPSIPVSQRSSGSTGSSYAGRVVEVHNSRYNNQTLSGSRSYGSSYPVGSNAGQAVAGSHANAWGIRKEAPSMKETAYAWSAPDAETKLAHASALEKVSSGRWNSKQQINARKDPPVIGRPETDGRFEFNPSYASNTKTYNRLDIGDSDSLDVGLVMHAERSLTVGDDIRAGVKEVPPTYERAKSTIGVESYERNTAVPSNGMQSIHPIVKPVGTEFQSTLASESSERPKLKLLPRSKPLESTELPTDHKQRYEQTGDHLYEEESHEAKIPVVGSRAPGRPKLNLKPRSQLIEQVAENSDAKRGTVFGEARPREMVLKARGIDDDSNNYEGETLRVKEVARKADAFIPGSSARYSEKPEGIPTDQRMVKHPNRRDNQLDGERSDSQRRNDQRMVKHPNRRDNQLDGERTDSQRRNKQNEIWKNNRDAEKHRNQQQKQLQDRPLSPETWRKPIDYVKPEPTDAPLRYGKVATAVELAQAFSKSVSDPTSADRLPGPRGIPGRNQLPFSRLTGPTPRPQINGY